MLPHKLGSKTLFYEQLCKMGELLYKVTQRYEHKCFNGDKSFDKYLNPVSLIVPVYN